MRTRGRARGVGASRADGLRRAARRPHGHGIRRSSLPPIGSSATATPRRGGSATPRRWVSLYAARTRRSGGRVVVRARAARHDVAQPHRHRRRARGSRPGARRAARRRRRSPRSSRRCCDRTPEHTGALHYLLHNDDDPQHAHLALGAARTLARLAPDSSHARHMPAHIFLQLGLWHDAAALGSRGVRGVRRVGRAQAARRRRCATTTRSSWLQYELLQLGGIRDAGATIDRARACRQGERRADAAQRSVVDARALRHRNRELAR